MLLFLSVTSNSVMLFVAMLPWMGKYLVIGVDSRCKAENNGTSCTTAAKQYPSLYIQIINLIEQTFLGPFVSIYLVNMQDVTVQGHPLFIRNENYPAFLYRQQSSVKGFSALPPEDRLLKFLVDNSTDCEETVQCSNCDLECKQQVLT